MDSVEVFDAISHPFRVEILRILEKGPIGFADLKRALGIESSGLLDFHLKKMNTIVTTNSEGLYELNALGHSALRAVDVVSRHGWQRRAFILNVFVYVIMNVFAFYISPDFCFIILALSTAWIVFYSYWTFMKRKVRLRRYSFEEEKEE